MVFLGQDSTQLSLQFVQAAATIVKGMKVHPKLADELGSAIHMILILETRKMLDCGRA